MGYPLPVCYFTAEELEKVEQKAHVAMLTHCGYNRYTAKAIVFGPWHLGGANFFHLYDIQGYGQITFFLKFWRSPLSTQGRMLRVVMAWAQYCAGTSTPILTDTTTNLPHLETHWISNVRQYLKAINGSIELDDAWVPKPQREGDLHLMDIAQAQNFTPGDLRKISYCQKYLGVVTIADIATADGLSIDPAMYHGQLDTTQSSATWIPVIQANPGPQTWQVWRKFCLRLCISNHNMTLIHPLGPWIIPPHQLRRRWPVWHDPVTDLAYRTNGTSYTSHRRLTVDFDNEPHSTLQILPETALPARTTLRQHTFTVHPNPSSWNLPETPHPATNAPFSDVVMHLPHWE